MSASNFKANHIVLLYGGLIRVGGAERLMFEEEKYLRENGFKTTILTFDFEKEVLFGQTYKPNIYVFNMKYNSKNLLIRTAYRILALRRKLREIRPDIIISANAWDCTHLYFATLFTPFPYVTHIHGTIFWFHDDLLKYALIHRKVFNEIRESVIGHKEFISPTSPRTGLAKGILKEFAAIAMYKAVRKAKKIFVITNQMRWEVSKLYSKDAVALKGAFPTEILDYKPKQNIKKKLGLEDKRMILNVNRLDPRKRVDLLIKAFGKICPHFSDIVLVIGGVGKEEGRLKDLTNQLNLTDKIKFVGQIREQELWDYFACCDIFVHPFWREFGIAAYEALALNRKVVWSTEMEIDEILKGNRHIFAANPTVDDFAQAMEKALITEVTEKNDLSHYTWDKYCEGIMKELGLPPLSPHL